MDTAVPTRHAGARLLARSVWPSVRGDRAVARVLAVGLALRLAIAGAVAVGTQSGVEEPGAAVAAIIGALVVTAWLAAGAFAKVALLAALDAHLSGRPTTARRCLARAARSARGIARWVAGQRRGGAFEGWAPRAAFTLPVLAIEDIGPLDAERRSEELYRARWGDAAVGARATVAVAVGTILVAFALGGEASWLGGSAGVAVGVLAVLALVTGLTASTFTRAVIALAAYRHQVHGAVPFGLTPAQLDRLVGR